MKTEGVGYFSFALQEKILGSQLLHIAVGVVSFIHELSLGVVRLTEDT
jgi:hypothetical protein